MAGKSNTSATFFAQKKLLGKAHTSNLKTDGEELIGSNIQAASSQIFGQPIPLDPSQTLYLLQSASDGAPATVEYIHFALTVLTGTTYDANETNPDGGSGVDSGESSQTSGPHAYKFVFRSDYESNSSNPKKGTIFNDNGIVHETLGKVQLVPPFFSQAAPNPYIINIYEDNGSGGIGDQIPLLDNIDWNVDFYNGILFLQDYNASKIPAHAKAFAYVGDFADKGFFETGLSGSLTQLTDGTSYLAAGNNITITSGSSGQITISSTAGGGGAVSSVGNGADNRVATFTSSDALNGEANLTFDGSTFTVTGDSFLDGAVVVNESGADKDFRIESSNKQSAIFVDGGTDQVLILSGGSPASANEANGTDVSFYVSGSVGSRGSAVRGTSLFGGDLSISGTLAVNQSAAVGSQVHITSAGKVGIGTSTPSYKLSVGGSMEIGEYLYHRNDTDTFVRLQADEITLSAGDKNMINLKEDGVNTQVLIMSGGAASSIDETTGNDVSFYVSGSVGSAKTNSKGTAVFGGDVVVSGSFVTSDISGSLTQLTDGTSYLVAGHNVTITSASNGQVTIASAITELSEDTSPVLGGQLVTGDNKIAFGTGDNTSEIDFTYNGGGNFTSIASVKSIDMFLDLNGGDSGQKFRIFNNLQPASAHAAGTNTDTNAIFMVREEGNVFTKGYITASMGFSGSLTQLVDGTSYLVAGDNVTITSASNGQVTITSAQSSPAGSDTQIQFNDGGSFGASSAFTFDDTTVKLHAADPSLVFRRTNNAQNSDINFQGAGGVVGAQLRFSGSSSNDIVLSTFNSSNLKERLRIRSNTADVAIEATGSLRVSNGITGSLTKLNDGTSYIISNGSITVTSQSNGSIALSAPNSVYNEYIGEADGSNTRFTLNHAPTANKNVSVFVNGLLQMPATSITGAPFQDYSVTGSTIFFVTASLPDNGSLLLANYSTTESI